MCASPYILPSLYISTMTVTSLIDVMIIYFPLLVGKTLCMQSRVTLAHLCICWHTCQSNLTILIATHELTHQFHLPISKSVTYIWSTLSKRLSLLSPPQDSGVGIWMIHLSSKRKSINRTSSNTLAVLTLPSSLQWGTIRRMGPSPSRIPLLNKRLMGNCLPLCTGNLPALTNNYSGIVNITSQPSLVLSTSSHIGPKQSWAYPQREHLPQECTNTIQKPQMGFGQGGERA